MTQPNARAAPREQEHDLIQETIDSLAEGIAIFGPDLRLIACNGRYAEPFAEVSDLIVPGVHWKELVSASTSAGKYPPPPQSVQEWVEAGDTSREILSFELKHESGRHYRSTYYPTKSGGFVLRRSDVTEQRLAEQRLKDSEELLKTVLDTIPIQIVMARKSDARVIYRSAEALRDFLRDFGAEHFADPRQRDDYVAELEQKGEIADYRVDFLRRDGSIYRATVAGRLVDYAGEDYVVSAIRDLTEQFDKEELLRLVVGACPTPLTMTRLDSGELLFLSPEARALFGDQTNAASYYVDPGDRAAYSAEIRTRGFVYDYRVQLRTAEGREFPAAISARLIRFRGEDVSVAHVRDLTEQTAIEEELAQQQNVMFQTEKMSALGELLAGVAHELNNPLSVVVGHALMLLEDDVAPEVRRHVDKISAAADRCARIVRSFLTMARQQPARIEPADLNEVVQTAVDVARYGEGHDITIKTALADDLPEIFADPDQITQVILNLVLNAEQAIAGSGKGDTIRVATRRRRRAEAVEISVEDNGPGIPEAIRGRIFEPFFTTREVDEGTGIGLALSHRIVHSHEGSIRIDPRHDPGTRFVISLPIGTRVPEVAGEAARTRTAPTSGKVLIVDDEKDVAELNGEILQREGYDVDVTNSVGAALALMRSHDYDLVLSDLSMPEGDGRALYDAILKQYPRLTARIGFVTGDTMGRASQTFLGEAGRPYLEKPVAPSELVAFAARILEGAEEPT